MGSTTTATNFHGDLYMLRADWADAASPIERHTEDGWMATGAQVADFRHSPAAAMRQELRDVVQASGDDPDESEIADDISKALTGATDMTNEEEEKAIQDAIDAGEVYIDDGGQDATRRQRPRYGRRLPRSWKHGSDVVER